MCLRKVQWIDRDCDCEIHILNFFHNIYDYESPNFLHTDVKKDQTPHKLTTKTLARHAIAMYFCFFFYDFN